MRTMTLLLLYY